jgi:hypothetical protein
VVGLEKVSSLDICRAGSRNAGDGDRVGLGASDSERGLGEFNPVLRDEEDVGVRSPSSSRCGKMDLLVVTSSAIVAIDIAGCWKCAFCAERTYQGGGGMTQGSITTWLLALMLQTPCLLNAGQATLRCGGV